MSDTQLYTLKENSTGQLHVFKSKKDDAGECFTETMSVCGKMRYNQTIKHHFACQTETFTRKKLAEIGRSVCGTCVSHLYGDYS
ncbi:hypothetical protein KORDIASMS9_03085 [Kordia sp. SMS9]|uniref:hypothetical protein n=1 Tax=Kordia sp. SMS9 TaxID=2282170 RepID=UPI000E0DB78B|nr:hypothetical protein [Kordia sp. SMS9]AXG70838.1 hypothetical protein KORDIASMS9_03085 [Kordia sp. SMS9]